MKGETNSRTRELPASSRKDEAGFSLLELAISTFLLLVVIMLATQLLLESRRLYGRAALARLETAPELAFTLLRRDLHAARAIAPLDPLQPTAAFTVTHAASSVAWFIAPSELPVSGGSCLTRVVIDRDGEEIGRRCLLADARSLVWLPIGESLTSVTITRRHRISPEGTRIIDDPRMAPDRDESVETTVIAAHRGSLRGRQW